MSDFRRNGYNCSSKGNRLKLNMSNLSKLLVKGGALARQGDVAGARTVFEKTVRDHGNRSEPWINLSAVHGMEGNYAEALRCAHRAVELAPNSLQGWVNLANAAQSCGDLAQAAEAFQRAHDLPGCPPDVAFQLSLTLVQLGKWQEAEKPLRTYLLHYPDHREATLTLAKTLAMKGEIEMATAMIEDYCRKHPGDVRALRQLGTTYLETARIQDAWHVCDQAMKVSSKHADALFLKAALLTFEGRCAEARDVYEQLDLSSPQVLLLLSQVCRRAGNQDAAIAYARAALKINRSVSALISLSSALLVKDPAEARRLMEEAVAIEPNNLSVMTLKGLVLEFEGDKQGAWECVRSVIEGGSLDPDAAMVAASVAPAIGKAEEAIEFLEQLVSHPVMPSAHQTMLRFALVKVCDKARHYDRAFGHAIIANRLKNVQYDHNPHIVELNRLKAVYSATAIASLPRSGIHSELPVFIVGMPRSGTSLLEQILSCHSKVHARGETMDISDIAAGVPYYPDGVRNLAQEKLDALAGTHIKRLSEMAPSATRVTDKLPTNYMYLGIISQLFPGARILNCQRDPRDICLSNYFTEFSAGQAHSYSLESLALVCKAYQEIMEHWKTVLPIPILNVRYEELIADPRIWVEKILNFCGLEWEDACLNFHQSKRLAVTASYDQVRQPLYKSSVARWKNYARHLEPVNRILGLKDDS